MTSWPHPLGLRCHSSVWGFTGFKLELELRGRRSPKLTDYQAEARCYLPYRAKTEAETMRQSRGSKVEGDARPRQDRVRPS